MIHELDFLKKIFRFLICLEIHAFMKNTLFCKKRSTCIAKLNNSLWRFLLKMTRFSVCSYLENKKLSWAILIAIKNMSDLTESYFLTWSVLFSLPIFPKLEAIKSLGINSPRDPP